MEDRFKVIYTGELQPYVTAQEAIRNVASMFKMSEDSVRALVLAGRAQEIKVNLDAVTAERYISALSKAGLVRARRTHGAAPKPDLQLDTGHRGRGGGRGPGDADGDLSQVRVGADAGRRLPGLWRRRRQVPGAAGRRRA